MDNNFPSNYNYHDVEVQCCENCIFSENNGRYLFCNHANLITNFLKVCNNYKNKAEVKRRKDTMTKAELLELSRKELKAIQLEALINATKEFLETCDDSLEKEVLEQLSSFQDELRELKVAYQLDF